MAPNTMPEADYLRECFDYNPDTGALIWKERPRTHFRNDRGKNTFNAKFPGTRAGTPTGPEGQLSVMINYMHQSVHRVVWKMMTGSDPINEIDHKDCDVTNNRWDNLREATRQQNCRNKRYKVQSSSLPKGVEKLRYGRYRARAQNEGRIKHLGVYDTPEQAHEAYCAFASDVHGEFFNSGKRK